MPGCLESSPAGRRAVLILPGGSGQPGVPREGELNQGLNEGRHGVRANVSAQVALLPTPSLNLA